MGWLITILVIVYISSAILCAAYLIFDKDMSSAGSVVVILCPILNTYICVKVAVKKKVFKELAEEIKETIEAV